MYKHGYWLGKWHTIRGVGACQDGAACDVGARGHAIVIAAALCDGRFGSITVDGSHCHWQVFEQYLYSQALVVAIVSGHDKGNRVSHTLVHMVVAIEVHSPLTSA